MTEFKFYKYLVRVSFNELCQSSVWHNPQFLHVSRVKNSSFITAILDAEIYIYLSPLNIASFIEYTVSEI